MGISRITSYNVCYTKLLRIDPDATFIEQSLKRSASGVAVMTAPEGFMPLNALQPAQITRLIDGLRARYDHVV